MKIGIGNWARPFASVWRVIVFTLVVCATTSAWAVAPTATAVWEGNFETAQGVYSITLPSSGITRSKSTTGNLVVGSDATTGATISLGSDVSTVTVLIKYSHLYAVPGKNVAMAGMIDSGNNNYALVTTAQGGLTLKAQAEDSTSYWTFSNSPSSQTGSGYFLYSYDATNKNGNGTLIGFGRTLASLTTAQNTGLKWTPKTISTISIGGPRTENDYASAWSGLVIEKIAIFTGNFYTANDLVEYEFPTKSRWHDNDTYAWRATQSTFHDSTLLPVDAFDIVEEGTISLDTTASYHWDRFAYTGSSNYKAPGGALFYDQTGYTAASDARFGPLTLGGLYVTSPQTAGDSPVYYSITGDGDRTTELGDPTGKKETYFVFDESFSIKRSGNNTTSTKLYGVVNVSVASGKTFALNAEKMDPSHSAVGTVLTTASGTAPVLKMSGDGKFKVSSLDASTGTLDFSGVTATPFIQGDLTVSANTCLVLPSGTEENAAYELCSGTLTAPAKTVQTTVQIGDGEAFTGYVTYDTTTKSVSYSTTAPSYTGTVNGSTITWDETPTAEDLANGNVVLTGSGEVTLGAEPISITAASGVTVVVTGYTSASLMGSGTFKYTSGYPTSVPSGITYQYVGGATAEASVTIPGVTVNGVLKTSGYLSLTTFSLPSGGSLDVLDGSTRVAGSSRALKGDVIVRDSAKLVYASNDLLDYAGSTRADIYGTLEIDGSDTRLLNESSSMSLNFYGGSTIKGTGYLNIANNQGFNVKENPANDAENQEVQFQGRLKYNKKAGSGSIISVDDGVTLVFSGEVYVHNINDPGYIRKCGLGKMKFASGVTTSSFLAYINVAEGTLDLAGLTFGTGAGQINVADNAILQVTGASTTQFLLEFSDGATLKIDGSASLTVSQAVTLPTGESESVTLDLRDATLPTGTASSTLLTASATLDLDVSRFEFEGASSDYYLSQNTTTGAVSIKLHAAKGSDGVYRDNLRDAFREILADHDLVITVLDGTGAANATLVKSDNIAWDTENNQFLYGYAKIGDEPYISLTAAIEASTIGDTITLLRNTTEEVAIKNGTILALGGFTVGSVSAESGYVLVPDDAENPTSYSTVEAKVSAEIGGDIRYFETLANALAAADGASTITLIADCSENANLAAGVTLVLGGHSYTGELSGSGTVVLSNLPTLNLASSWTGTVWLKNQSGIQIIPTNYGNANSVIRFTGITGWIANETTCSPAFEFEDDGDTKALTMYYTSAPSTTLTFSEFRGTGTFVTAGDDSGYTRTNFRVQKWSDFTGSLDIDRGRVIFGEDKISTDDWRYIYVSTNETATVASGKIWKAYDGFRVNGTLNCNGGKIYGTGASETLKLGGSGSIVNTFEGGDAQCFNAGAITVSGSLQVKMVGDWSNFGTWTLTDTASLGFDPGTDDQISIGSSITTATVNNTLHIYGNGSNKVIDDVSDGTKYAAIRVHNGGKIQVATATGSNDYLQWYPLGTAGAVTVDAGGEAYFYSRETYTRNTYLNGGKITLAGMQGSRSFDIHASIGVNVSEDSIIESTGTSHWIYLRNGTPTFTVAANKTLTVNASFKAVYYQNMIKSGAGTMVVNGYVDGSGNHESFSQPKGVTINAGTYELNAEQTSNNQTGADANFYTVAAGAKLKIGATGRANMTTLNLVDGSLLEFGAGDETLITANTVIFTSGEVAVSLSEGVTPTNGTKLIGWTNAPAGGTFTLEGCPQYHVVAGSDGLYLMKKPGTIFSVW